ncbi:MAG: HD domain-containing protein, partial [Planctomycetaceae bacterium]
FFKSSITGRAMERATLAEYEQFLSTEYPGIDLESELDTAAGNIDRFQVYRALLLPLDGWGQLKKWHPEGDVLYHSLQVFELARDELPYDEEFILAALLHDTGRGLAPDDHIAAGLDALDGFITRRTAWLIEHHMDAHLIYDRTIGQRALRRLRASPDFDELCLLGECDRAGRQPGVDVPDLDEALDYVRDLARQYG